MKNLDGAIALFESFQDELRLEVRPSERRRFLIERTSDWEIILMAWGPGAATPIHTHGGSHCWTKVLKGTLAETLYDSQTLEVQGKSVMVFNDGGYIDDQLGAHLVSNPEAFTSFTLHLYTKPIDHCLVYEPNSGEWVTTKIESETYQRSFYELASRP